MSGWNFLNKAETFLDRVLDEPKEGPGPASVATSASATPARTGTPAATGRLSLQERLARAAASAKTGSPVPAPVIAEPVKPAAIKQLDAPAQLAAVKGPDEPEHGSLTENQRSPIFPANRPDTVQVKADAPATEAPVADPKSARTSIESPRQSTEVPATPAAASQADTKADPAAQAAERISALEAKLRYYTADDLAHSRAVLRDADTDALERKLAERAERITLLVQEGDTLAKQQGVHLETIRKLRARCTELEKLIAVSLKAVEKAEADVAKWKGEHKTVGEVSKRQQDKIRQLAALETEADSLRKLKTGHVATISDLKRQLADAQQLNVTHAGLAAKLQAEKEKTEALQKKVGVLLQEAKEQADEQDGERAALQAKYTRLEERSRQIEADRKAEVFRLESEVEALRAQVEESSAGAAEHVQTKLLRQMETLQTQHSITVQNWSRIEENLMARSQAAEDERDRLEEAEAALKSKIRDQAVQLKQLEEALADGQGALKRALAGQDELREQVKQLQAKCDESNAKLEAERARMAEERKRMAADIETQLQERLESERSVYDTNMAPFLAHQNNGARSPELSFSRGSVDSPANSFRQRPPRPTLDSRRTSNTLQPLTPSLDRRRSSNHMADLDGMRSPPLEDGIESNNLASLAEQPLSRALSVVTSSAGPGLGMLERVSATARKLELELSLAREDLTRMTQQRDAARQACVELDAAAEERTRAEQALAQIKEERAALAAKFEATLELLGEQTEENEQLREDIADMKQAYRETLQQQFGK